MIVQHGGNNNSSNQNKGATTNASKAAARKSILMQITKARVANSFHLTERQGYNINVNKIWRRERSITRG
jgi:hypothetical protein